jgi:hypothetical protein
VVDLTTVTTEPDSLAGDALQPEPEPEQTPHRSPAHSRRRFIVATIVGLSVILPIYLWALWYLWSGSLNPLRAVPYDNFYDLQARALFHGHLHLPNGYAGIEAFVHDGRQYTYFGLFPSIIRMPILLVTSRLDGQMTGPSILVAWCVTALFSALMLWRLRILMRGEAVVGRAEAASYGALMATIMGGSVILYLAATPSIYNEDFAWSIPLTLGSLFALLGVLERPSRGRVITSGVLILCANFDRSPPGWACSIAALLIAGWFALGRGEASNRRWALPMVAVGMVPFLVSCVVTYAKFGIPVGLPMADQVWATVNAHRRYFLAVNGGRAFSFAFLPSTLTAYFQPLGIRLSGIFPFVAPPAAPAAWLAGAVLDQSYPTASFTDTSPLLLLLGCWGAVAAFRPRAVGKVRLTRIILLGAAAGAGGVLLWGLISQRYLGDLMPFFIIASGIGLIDVWRHLENRARRIRGLLLGTIVTIGVYCLAANLAIAAFPVNPWTITQAARFVSMQKSLSISSLASTVRRGSTLPYWAPAGTIFAMKDCSGLYLSTGNDMRDVPGQQIQHYTWKPVEQSSAFTHTIGFTFNRPVNDLTNPLPLMTYGKSTLVLQPAGPGRARLEIDNSGTSINWPSAVTWPFAVPNPLFHEQLRISVLTDPNLKSIVVEWYGETLLGHYLAGAGPAVVQSTKISPRSAPPVVTVANLSLPAKAPMTLCQSLNHNR